MESLFDIVFQILENDSFYSWYMSPNLLPVNIHNIKALCERDLASSQQYLTVDWRRILDILISLLFILLSTLDVFSIWECYHSQLCFDILDIKFCVYSLVYLKLFSCYK